MHENMTVVVSVMQSRVSVMSLVQTMGTHGDDVMYFGCVCFKGELDFFLQFLLFEDPAVSHVLVIGNQFLCVHR